MTDFSRSLIIIFLALTSALTAGCKEQAITQLYTNEIDSIAKKWVPDPREGICGARLYRRDGRLVLSGVTNLQEAKEEIEQFLIYKNIKALDSLLVVPDTNDVKKFLGLVDVSVCNIRSDPGHNMELTSQALLGTPVRILIELDGWLRIQTPDSYIGWVDEEAIARLTSEEYSAWKHSERIIFLEKNGDIVASPADHQVISDIVEGAVLQAKEKYKGYIRVVLPDGRSGFLPEQSCMDFTLWASNANLNSGKLLKTAKSLMGTPYLWGGTSVKGLDCSGFMKTIYFLNGTILARDASLQVKHGIRIDNYNNLLNLEPGDLLFFGREKTKDLKPTHVGMYIGNTEFIHESGRVRINSLDSTQPNFTRYRYDSFVAARRLIGADPDKGLQKVIANAWYF